MTWQADSCVYFASSLFSPTISGGLAGLEVHNATHVLALDGTGFGTDATRIIITIGDAAMNASASALEATNTRLTFATGPQLVGNDRDISVRVAPYGTALVTEADVSLRPTLKVCANTRIHANRVNSTRHKQGRLLRRCRSRLAWSYP